MTDVRLGGGSGVLGDVEVRLNDDELYDISIMSRDTRTASRQDVDPDELARALDETVGSMFTRYLAPVVEVSSQSEFDAAIAAGAKKVDVVGNQRLVITDTGTSEVRLRDEVVAEVRGTSRVEATDDSTLIARDGANVVASGRATAHLFDRSTMVEASGSARVRAHDKSNVLAIGAVHVEAFGNALVDAYDRARVRAHGDSVVFQNHDTVRVEAAGPEAQVRKAIDFGDPVDVSSLRDERDDDDFGEDVPTPWRA